MLCCKALALTHTLTHTHTCAQQLQDASALIDAKLQGPGMDSLHQKMLASPVRVNFLPVLCEKICVSINTCVGEASKA